MRFLHRLAHIFTPCPLYLPSGFLGVCRASGYLCAVTIKHNYMKKIFLLLLVSIVAVSFSGCKNDKDKALAQLQSQMDQINAKCPVQVDGITTWESIEVADGNIVYNYTVADTEDGQVIKAFKEKADDQKAIIKNALKGERNFKSGFQPLAVKADLGIKYIYKSSANGEKVEVLITPKEVAEL